MMIRVNGEYLDFDSDIEIESQIKLFQDIETANGDYSYSFEISKTNKNLKALGLPFPDTIKSIYQNVPCEIVDDSGFVVRVGSLQITNINQVINATFFGGNNDWFALLSDPMASLPLYKYDVDLTEANIQASWVEDSGIVFPILDAGVLVTRSLANLKVEDFTSCFYVKTLFSEIFNPLGIKLEGDFINDSTYNKLQIAANGKSQNDIDSRSFFANKTAVTARPVELDFYKILFQDDSTFPYFNGEVGNFNLATSTYTADVKMLVKVEVALGADILDSSYNNRIYIYINGVWTFVDVGFPPGGGGLYNSNGPGGAELFYYERNLILEAGDTLEVYSQWQQSLGSTQNDIIQGTFKITPLYIYKVFGNSSVPNWTQGEFVSNILRIFNVLPSYNAIKRTLTLNVFNKIKDKQPIDVSEFITVDEIDFSEFVSSYAKNNYFKYQESDDEDLRQYNISNFISYGEGNLTIDNEFIENDTDIIESDFTSPITYYNGIFSMSMERINFVELEDQESQDITSVSDASGTPRFNMAATGLFTVGDLVRIETGKDYQYEYEGEWVVNAVASTYVTVNGLVSGDNAVGTMTLLRHKFTTDDNVYLLIGVPNVEVGFFSTKSDMLLEEATTFSTSSLSYFNLLSNGRQINTKYKQSLSFGTVNNPLSYQKTILDTYWPIFSAILNDPVMLKISAYFNKKTYSELSSFLRPLRIKTNETNNLYYLNKLTGYKNGHESCQGELIKL